MSDQSFVIRNTQDRERLVAFLCSQPLDKPLQVDWKNWSPKRSLNANALYWSWLTQLAEFFNQKEKGLARKKSGYEPTVYDREDMHDMMRHLFLGYENRKIRNTEITQQLKSTTKLSRADFCDYMTQIDRWALSYGCFLPHPEDSEYARYLEQTA